MPPNTGSVISSDRRAAAQAKSIGATIGGDGWWYKDGRKLSTQEADQLTNQRGTAITSTDTAHGAKPRDIWGRTSDFISKGWKNSGLDRVKIGGSVGGLLERNKADLLAVGGFLLGGPYAAAAVKAGFTGAKHGATGRDAAGAGLEGYLLGKSLGSAQAGAASAKELGTNQVVGWGKGLAGFGPKSAPTTVVPPVALPAVSYVPPPVTEIVRNAMPPLQDILGYGTKALGFLEKHPAATKGAFNYLSGATKQQSDINDAKLEEIMLGNEAVALEKRRKKQYGEMLAQLFASGFFGNPSGTSTPR